MMRFWRDFRRDERGALSVIVLLVFLSMLMLFFAAFDIMRTQLVRSRLWAAMDSAVLAAGANLGSSTALSEGTAYFNANMPANFLGATISTPSYSCAASASATPVPCTSVPASAGGTLVMTATASVPLTVLLNGQDYSFTVTTKSTRFSNPTEAVLALDNTGSMGGQKIASLRSAANTLVATLLGNGGAVAAGFYVGLVPFTETVRVGDNAATRSWMTGSPPNGWQGCLFERKIANAYTVDATAPSTAQTKFSPYYDTSCSTNWWTGQTTCEPTTQQDGCVPASTMFLSSDQAALTASINAMQAKGSTMIASGMVWAWRMLSPGWSNLWGVAGRPLPFCQPGVQSNNCSSSKAIILLTDGDNDVSSNSPYASPYGNPTNVPPYGNLVGTDNANANTMLLQACSGAKAAGITVYTISFGTGMTSATKQLLQNCASQPSYYFDAPTSSKLTSAFSSIAGSLSKLVLTQ